MMMVRPVEFSDLTALEQLALSARGLMTTLPVEREHLETLIDSTRQSLLQDIDAPGGETYHFVLEDTDSNTIAGVAGIDSAVGLRTPFFSYRLEDVIHASDDLQIHNRVPALKLCHDYTGYTGLCTFYLSPDYDSYDNLQLLSRARLLFIAHHRDRFADRVLAELQGVTDEDGKSPFWENLGRHFFSMELEKANYLSGIRDKGFIADLMPRYPVYTTLLSRKARSVIGEVRPDRSPVVALLEQEGFSYEGYVDIFDAGPTLEASIDRLSTVRDSRIIQPESNTAPIKQQYLVSTLSTAAFRCVIAPGNVESVNLNNQIFEQLGLSKGESVRSIPLY